MEGRRQSVRYQAKQMGVTRARVYQLLEDCSKVMAVRWPEGEHLLARLTERYQVEGPEGNAARLLFAAVDLIFPRNQELARVAAGRVKIAPAISPAMVEPADSV